MNEIVTINKPRGLTPLQAVVLFKNKFPAYKEEKISYAGRLDPMAEGLLILLIGNQNKNRNEFESLKKTYEFDILLGISTDTYDALGIITKSSLVSKNKGSRCVSLLPSFIGEHDQAYPPYSSMTVSGKPLYYWAREKKLETIKIPAKTITISSLVVLSKSSILAQDLIDQTVTRISKVKGDFRQNEIIDSWRSLSLTSQSFSLLSCRTEVSSGTYIRSLAHRIGIQLGCGAIAYRICRTNVGDYELAKAISID